ncbi:hypothetical protein PLESTB_000814700 [Pleodorina starrii]|uniref:Nudix hydrolase domain-containing protein n=1 Tax=Pleodorina starrii TaxID=330485 RepID=A0A9W6F380_9CHLO|nr:hypothetical protein PLESTM_000130300 [Pleodorina starrii]GLC54016.1 hypothetical protein PLESTB_000814700 [Pleodorina starrii]GLC64678.1 hypothetical protein PLESTF_000191600 [Pleodorina starrii]
MGPGAVGAPSKIGAGLLICCEGACLLLRRSEDSGNPGTWGLPGGNADAADGGQLLTTAMREAREELGELPPGLEVLGSVLTRRGKSLQKHYTVFVASIPGAARAAYRPTLNDEHTEWRWLDLRHAAALAAAPGAPAHCPTGPGFLGDPDDDEAAAAAAGPPTGNMVLHPVVRVMFGGAHAEALGSMLPSVGAKPGAEQ